MQHDNNYKATMETISEEGELHTKNKANDLFKLCDQDNKGYVTNDDLKQLQGDLGLSVEQIETVFTQLDKNGDGYLTAEEFESGLEVFLGNSYASKISQETQDDSKPEFQPIDHCNSDDDSITKPCELPGNLEGSGLLQDNAHIELWSQIEAQHPELLPAFREFLQNLSDKHEQIQSETEILKQSFHRKSTAYENQIRILYEEMENQIKEEKEAIISQKCNLEKRLRQQLDDAVEMKDRDVQELLEKWLQASMQLKDTNETKEATENENMKLIQEKELLELQLDKHKQQLQELHERLEEFKTGTVREKRQHFWSAFKLSEKISWEREALVKQLQLLRSINRRLQDENDERDVQEEICEPLSFDLRSKRGSVMSDYFEVQKSQTSSTSSNHDEMNNNEDFKQTMLMPGTKARFHSTNPFLTDDVFIPTSDSVSMQTFAATNPFAEDLKRKKEKQPKYMSFKDPDLDNIETISSVPNEIKPASQIGFDCQQDKKLPALCLIHPNNHQVNTITDPLSDTVLDLESKLQNDGNCNEKIAGVEIENERKSLKNGTATCSSEVPNTEIRTAPGQIPDCLYKIVFIGDSGVGKTSLINRICGGQFSENFCATIGVDFRVKNLAVDGHQIVLQLWDTAGQERFRSITTQYLRKSDGVLIVYDVNSELSFLNVCNWVSSLENVHNENVVVALLGNKADLSATNKIVPTGRGRQLADDNDALFFETSAKDGTGIEELIFSMARNLQKQQLKEMESSVNLTTTPTNMSKKKCC